MISEELLAQIESIQLRAGHQVTEALAGNYISAFRGQGMEFDEVREYVPGDDVRSIDWNVTARMQQPFIKVFREEREMTLMLVVDVSSSLQFGTTGRFKIELACEMAAVLAYLAIRNNDKVGLIVFSDTVEKFVPPKKGRGHVWRIIREVLAHESQGEGTDIKQALDFMMQVQKRRSLCFLISDFFAADYTRSLQIAARRHDLVAINTEDRRERELPRIGIVDMIDPETGNLVSVDTSSNLFQEHLAKYWREHDEQMTATLRRAGVDQIQLETGKSVVDPLVDYMLRREKRKVMHG